MKTARMDITIRSAKQQLAEAQAKLKKERLKSRLFIFLTLLLAAVIVMMCTVQLATYKAYAVHRQTGRLLTSMPVRYAAVQTEPDEPDESDELEMTSLGEFKISFYCCERRAHICGTGSGLTANGTPVREGLCAVDTDVIPLGTKLYIEGYGWLEAADTGGKIKGRRLDIAVDKPHDEVAAMGVMHAQVFAEAKQ